MRQPKIGLFGQFRPTGVDNTETQTLQRMAGLAGSLGGIAAKFGVEKAQKEGKLEGLQSVQSEGGKTKPIELREDSFSIRNKSFNEGAILAHRAAIQTDSKNTLDALQREESQDPDMFALRAGAYAEGLKSDMPEELAVLVGSDLESSINSRSSQLKDQFFKRIEIENKAVMAEGLESFKDDILNATRQGDLDRVENLSVNLQAMMNQAEESGNLDPRDRVKIEESLRESGLEQAAYGEIERALTDAPTSETIAAATDHLKSLKKKTFKDLEPKQKDKVIGASERLIDGAISDLLRGQARNKARLTGEIKSLNSEISRAKSNLNAGINVNKEELNGLIEKGYQINEQTGESSIDVIELRKEIREMQEVNTFSANPKRVREAQEAHLVQRERSGKLTSEEGETLRRIRKANSNINASLDKKGIEFYQEQGLGELGDLAITNEEGNLDAKKFIESLQDRKKVTNEASTHYSRDLSPFTEFEAEQLTRMYEGQSSIGKGAILQTLVTGLDDMSIDALAQISKKGAGVMALSGAIMVDGGDPSLILQGQELLKEPANKNLLPTGGDEIASFEREIFVRLGAAYGQNGPQRGAVIQSIKAAYAALSAKNGAGEETMNKDQLDQAINAVTGGIVELNGRSVSSPVRGMDQSGFEDFIDSLDETSFDFNFQELPEIDKKLLIEQIQDNGVLYDIGAGEYIVEIGGSSLVDTNGEPYILNLRRIYEGKK